MLALKRIVVDTDTSQRFRRTYGLTTDALLLIRPDGYIGHIATHDMLSTTQAAAKLMAPPALQTTE